MEKCETYLDFAESDYLFFRSVYDAGFRNGPLAAMGANICEKYLKHIVSEYANPENDKERYRKESALCTHNLQKLLRYIQNEMRICVPEHVEDNIGRISGFYFSTQYPSDDSFIATERDVEKANAEVECARDFALEICKDID